MEKATRTANANTNAHLLGRQPRLRRKEDSLSVARERDDRWRNVIRLPRFVENAQRFVGLYFASCRHMCSDKPRMSARILISGLLAGFVGRDALSCAPGAHRAVCASCIYGPVTLFHSV